MQIPMKQMSLAMDKVNRLAAGDGNVPGVLLKIREGYMNVCYSNGKQALTEVVELVQDEGDIRGDIVVPYKRLADIVATLQPVGRIQTSDLTVLPVPGVDGVLEVTATKNLIMYKEGAAAQDEQAPAEVAEADSADSAAPRENFDSPEYMQGALDGFELAAAPQSGAANESGTDPMGGLGSSGQATAKEGDYVEEVCTVSEFKQRLTYCDPASSALKYGILTRMDYDGIFVGDDGETNGDFDSWNLTELRDMLTRMSIEKNRTIYASHAQGAVFVVNIAYASWIATENVVNNGFTITTNLAKSVCDILASMSRSDIDEVLIKTKGNRYVCITDTNNRVGFWYEMVAPVRTDAATLSSYREKKYEAFRVLFSREALDNVLNSALTTDKVEKTTLSFTVVDTSLAMRIVSTDSAASVSNTFDVISYGANTGMDVMLREKLTVSLKTLSDMVKNCTGDFVELALEIPATGGNDRYIRLGDILLEDKGYNPENSQLTAAHYAVASAG